MDQAKLHGGWWPSYVAHHGPASGGRHRHHFHYRRDQLIVDAGDLERVQMRLRALGVDCRIEEHVEDLGVSLLGLGQSRMQVPDLVEGLHVGWEEAPPLVGPNHVLGPCHHQFESASTPMPTEVPLPPIPSPDPAGEGATVIILDSGYDPDNEWLRGRVDGDPEKPILDDRGRMIPNCGHGTFVAGQILQYAPSARVIARRVFDDNGVVQEWELAKALNNIEDADVVNMSIGSFARRDSAMLAVERAQQRLLYRNPDVVLVAAAGNEGVTRPMFPAADKCVIAVGSVGPLAAGVLLQPRLVGGRLCAWDRRGQHIPPLPGAGGSLRRQRRRGRVRRECLSGRDAFLRRQGLVERDVVLGAGGGGADRQLDRGRVQRAGGGRWDPRRA